MMSEIVDYRYAVDFTPNFTAPAHALKGCERITDRFALNSPCLGGDDDAQGVAHVELADERCCELGPLAAVAKDAEARHPCGKIDVPRLPVRVVAGSERFQLREQPLTER